MHSIPHLSVVRTAGLLGALARRHSYPYSITFILTHRCNFRCDYCDAPASAADELSTGEWCLAIDELADAGMARASFSGGEALLRSDALDVITHAKRRGCFTSLNSNGWVAERSLDALTGVLDMLVLSLDGPEVVHDRARRMPGSYERVLRTVDAARARGLSVATISVIGPWNLAHIGDVLGLAQDRGFWAYFQPAYADCFSHDRGFDGRLNSTTFARMAVELARGSSRGLPVGASPGFLERLRRGPDFGDCSSCAAGRYFATVMPDGQVVPCHLTSRQRVWPNGREHGFAEAFSSLARPSGSGCAISPYQETDLIFGGDLRAIKAALTRALTAPRSNRDV